MRKNEQVGEHWEGEVCVEEVGIEVEVLSAGVKLDKRLSHEISPAAPAAAAGAKEPTPV